MTQKKRRPSKLVGQTPLAPHVDEQAAHQPAEVPEEDGAPQETITPPAASVAPRKAPQAVPKAPRKKKVSFYLSPEEEARAEAARNFTMGFTGLKTVTSYYEKAIADLTRKLEAEYNDSKPFGKPFD